MLSRWLLGLMALQAVLGIAWPGHYRDTGHVAGTWLGNDLVTLVLACPALLAGMALDPRGSRVGAFLRSGAIAYAVYNYAFYLLGATLNPLFPLYVLTLVVAASALILTLARTDPWTLLGPTGVTRRDHWVGAFMAAVATGLAAVSLVIWGAHVFAGAAVPGDDPEAFRLVAALDLTLIVPVLGCGGLLLWRRSPWGYWGGLVVATGAATALLLAGVRGPAQPPSRY